MSQQELPRLKEGTSGFFPKKNSRLKVRTHALVSSLVPNWWYTISLKSRVLVIYAVCVFGLRTD